MCWKIFMVGKKKSEIPIRSKNPNLCYLIVQSVEKNTESKNPKVVRTKSRSMQYVLVKNWNLLKNKKLRDY